MRLRWLAASLALAAVSCGSSSNGSDSKEKKPEVKGEVFKLAGDNPLEAELREVSTAAGRKITARIVFRNPGTKMISFKRAQSELLYKGAKLYARDLGWTGHEADVDLPPGATKSKYWAFHTDGQPESGTYDLVISGIVVHEGAERRPAGSDLTIKVKVP
jgi:hypothetical protein